MLRGNNHNSTYELVIRLFSKIPFLQYIFRASSEEYSLEDMVDDALNDEIQRYDELITEEVEDLDKYLGLEQNEISDEFINSELNRLLGV